jgi:cold-inducible RNA-binding protein
LFELRFQRRKYLGSEAFAAWRDFAIHPALFEAVRLPDLRITSCANLFVSARSDFMNAALVFYRSSILNFKISHRYTYGADCFVPESSWRPRRTPAIAECVRSLEHGTMKLYVGNLSFSTTEEGLQNEFSAFGQVEEVAVISDRDTGRPRGFAFVTMNNDGEARAAIESLNGTELDGRTITVNEARPKTGAGGGGGRGGPRGGGGGGGGARGGKRW